MVLDDAPAPAWVPDSYQHFDLKRYSFDELVGIIKARAQEHGAALRPVTAVEMAVFTEAVSTNYRT